MKYAVIKSGGKQHKVKEGDQLFVEKVEGKEGDTINIDKVVMVNNGDELLCQAGELSKAEVKATILKHVADEKVIVLKYRPKKGYRKKRGHRQPLTMLRIDKINLSKGRAVGAKEAKAKQEGKQEGKPVKKRETKTKKAKESKG